MSRSHNDYFNVDSVQYRFLPRNVDDEANLWTQFADFFEEVENFVHVNFEPDDYVEMFVSSAGLNNNVAHPLVRVDQFDPTVIIERLSEVLNSQETVHAGDGTFSLQLYHVPAVRGGHTTDAVRAKRNLYVKSLEQLSKDTRSLVDPPAFFNPLCGAVCLLLGKDRIEFPNRRHRASQIFRRQRGMQLLKNRAEELCIQSGVKIDRPLTLRDMRQLCRSGGLCQYCILIHDRDNFNSVVLKENVKSEAGTIHLLLSEGHYRLVTNLSGYYGRKAGTYCVHCEKWCVSKRGHVCDVAVCKACKTQCDAQDLLGGEKIECDSCLRLFHSQTCFDRHLRVGGSAFFGISKRVSVCESIFACPTCKRDLKTAKGRGRQDLTAHRNAYDGTKHVCFELKCRVCRCRYDSRRPHDCYVQKIDLSRPETVPKFQQSRGEYCFYDMETMIATEPDTGEKYFKVCLIVFRNEAGDVEKVFSGAGALAEFVQFLFFGEDSLAATGNVYHVLAHNGAKFDTHFILQEFCRQSCVAPKIVWDGEVFKQFVLGKVFINDSFLFIKAPLAAFAKMFGLLDSKTFFPHAFNTEENQNYVGPIPPKEMFDTRFMTEEKHAEFERWYAEWTRVVPARVWDLQKIMLEYCRMDVKVLAQGFLKFAKIMFDLTGIPVCANSCTLAGYTNKIWRSMIESHQIPVVPRGGYGIRDQQSLEALEYLTWQNAFYHAGNMQYANSPYGEKRLAIEDGQKPKKLKVDGYCQDGPNRRHVVEFLGCAYHGCLKCFHPSTVSLVGGMKMRDLHLQTVRRLNQIRSVRGVELDAIWGCEWKRLKESDLQVREQLQEIGSDVAKLVEPIDPRNALYGGRTEAFYLLFESLGTREDHVRFLDFTSLYPAVMKEGIFPLGKPHIYRSQFNYSDGFYFGLIKCKLLPPRQRFLPSIPTRVPVKGGGKNNRKLVFPLCVTCAREQNFVLDSCRHSDEERTIEGTYVSCEVYEATSKYGYTLTEIQEVWHYTMQRPGLFRDFVNKFLKIKQEASGWPAWATTDDLKQQYLRDYKAKEGIELDPSKIEYNGPVRDNAKAILNSLWGGWVKNLDRIEKELIFEPGSFHKWVEDESATEKHFTFVADNAVAVTSRKDERFVPTDSSGCYVHGCFVTAYARIKLMGVLEKLGEKALYCDTDSLAFPWQTGDDFQLPEGDYLGELTSVFKNPHRAIREFVSGGAKNYGLTTFDRETGLPMDGVMKVRGITLNRESQKHVTIDKLKEFILDSVVQHREMDGEEDEGEEEDDLPEMNASGFLTESQVKVSCFTIRGGSQKRSADGSCDSAAKRFKKSPEIYSKVFRVVFDKRVVDWGKDGDRYVKTYPFGYRFTS